jgi:WD40 repeat protein
MENNREEAPGAKLLTYEHQGGCVNAVSWSPDGLFVASGRADATLRIWDAATAQTQLILRAHSDIVKAVAWSPDGHRLASASRDGTVLVWESASGELLLKYEYVSRQCHRRDTENWTA